MPTPSPLSASRAASLAAPLAGVRIGFVKYYDKGSTVLGADQVAAGLRTRGLAAEAIYPRQLASFRDGILVFVKTSRLDHLLASRARGNRLALDVQDTVCFKRRIKNRWLYDALIFKNRLQLVDFGRRGRLDRVIYHQWDARYSPQRAPADRLSVAYLGIRRSFSLWGRFPEVECVEDDIFGAAPRFNCHLSVRPPGRETRYKPNCKVSTAAACEAVLVSTPDATTVELLGEDYPFYCDFAEGSIRAALERAAAAMGTAEWRLALERLRAVRERTSLDRVLDDYVELFAAMAPGRGGGAAAEGGR